MDWSKEWWRIVAVMVLIMMSGLFSGLTLGLMSLDVSGLEIVIKGGSAQDAKNAKKIAPIRENGNLLLCTLLMGNVAVNAALSIVMADMSNGLVGFFVSTFVIVIFGEIIPQAVCSRYALKIGALSVWPVKIIMLILLPICWPMAKILDCALGKEIGTIYSKNELRQLLDLHVHEKTLGYEADIMTGALDFAEKQVGEIMQPIEKVFMLEVHVRLDFSVLTSIFKSGYSRIPCYDKSKGNELVGLLIVKDLILIDPSDEVPILTLLNFYGRGLPKVFPDTSLSQMLDTFKAGRSHMAVVHDVDNSDVTRDPVYKNLGIITLEDIMETILKAEIADETDEQGKFSNQLLNIFDHRRALPSVLTPQEASAVYFHLTGTIEVFSPGVCLTETGLKRLISESRILEVVVPEAKNGDHAMDIAPERWPRKADEADDVANGGRYIYQMGLPSEYFVLILDGAVEIRAGRDGFRSEAGRWNTMGTTVLEGYHNSSPDDGDRPTQFVPDFSAKVTENARLLRISCQRWAKMMKEEAVVQRELANNGELVGATSRQSKRKGSLSQSRSMDIRAGSLVIVQTNDPSVAAASSTELPTDSATASNNASNNVSL